MGRHSVRCQGCGRFMSVEEELLHGMIPSVICTHCVASTLNKKLTPELREAFKDFIRLAEAMATMPIEDEDRNLKKICGDKK